MTMRNAFEDLSTEATLAALKTVADSILVASNNIKTAVEELNTKTTAVNTTALAQQETVAAINDLADTMTHLISGVSAKMGVINKLGVLHVTADPSAGLTVIPAGNYNTGNNVMARTTTDPATLSYLYRSNEPWSFSNMGALHLYDGIQIS